MDWDFAKTNKKCTNCNKMLPADEFFFSALFLDESKNKDERFMRSDYCSTCWVNKPESIFSYWKTKTTVKQAPKTPREVLIEFFDNMINPVRKTDVEAISVDNTSNLPHDAELSNEINPSQDKTAEIPVRPDVTSGQSEEEGIRSKIIYLFSLILLRRKIFKIKESIQKDNQPYIVFERIPDGKIYEVAETSISDEELVKLKDQFSKLFEFEI